MSQVAAFCCIPCGTLPSVICTTYSLDYLILAQNYAPGTVAARPADPGAYAPGA